MSADRGDRRSSGEVLARAAVPLVSAQPGIGDRLVDPAAEGSQGVEDDDDVDRLLEERAGDDGQEPEGRDDHRDERHAHAGDDALERDRPRAAGDPDGLRQSVEPVDRDDDVGGLGRRRRPAGAHRDADVGERRGRARR